MVDKGNESNIKPTPDTKKIQILLPVGENQVSEKEQAAGSKQAASMHLKGPFSVGQKSPLYY